MQIVIEIDEDIAQGIIDGENDTPRNIVRSFQATIADAIKNGTPLPEEEQKAINELEKSTHIQTLNTVKTWLEQPICGEYISRDAVIKGGREMKPMEVKADGR